MAEDSVPLAEFTTYLGSLVDLSERSLNKKTLQIRPLINKEILGKYEATLTICCYFSRLIYEKRTRILLKMYKILEYSPLVFNKALSYLTFSKPDDTSIQHSQVQKKPSGYLLYDPDHHTCVSLTINQIIGEKCLTIAFRGTHSTKTLLKDINILYKSLFDLYGKELFSEEFEEVGDTNRFSGHKGFITGLINIYPRIIDRIKKLIDDHKVARIFITGHSLGGAYACILGMALGQMRKIGEKIPDIHIISFGAPKIFSYYSRNVFNGLLLDGYITLDRVTNRPRFPDPRMSTYDPIALVPANFNHPGFSILNTEIKTQSRTGRTKHISELRDELCNIKPNQKTKVYDVLPDYKEFLSNFKDSSVLTIDEYNQLLSTTPGGRVHFGRGPASKIINIIKTIYNTTDEEIIRVEKIADNKIKEEIKEMKKETLKIPKKVIKDIKEIKAAVNKAYKEAGEPNTPKVKEGGGNGNIYRSQSVLEQPNHVVYSCSQITASIPIIGCHLGYMGISWVREGISNSGNSSWHEYNKEAVLYETEGNWTFVSDKRRLSKTRKISR